MDARARTGHAGFAVVELLVALTVVALILAAAGTAFQFGALTLLAGSEQVEAQQNARWMLGRVIQEIRGAGYDPTASPPAYNFDAITNQTATSLTLQSDLNGNGALDAPTAACDPTAVTERSGYRLVGTELRRSTDPPTNSCEAVIVSGVSTLGFTYLDADGNTAASTSAIRTVAVSVTMASEGGGSATRAAAMTDRVRLRNR